MKRPGPGRRGARSSSATPRRRGAAGAPRRLTGKPDRKEVVEVKDVRTIPWVTLILAAAAAVVFAVPGAAEVLEFHRPAVQAGEVWRIASGHWAHFSAGHLAWSLMAFVVLGALCERRSRSRF